MITKTANRTRLSMSGLTYDFEFRIDDDSELLVYGITSLGVATLITTGYTVAFDADEEEGTITFSVEPATYAEILMLRSKPYTQPTNIPIREGFSEAVIEKAGLDNVVIQIQQLKELIDSAIKQDPTSVLVDITLPTPEDDSLIAWDGVTGDMKNMPAADFIGATGPTGPTGPAGADGTDGADGIFSAIASQAEAEAGAENTKGMTPLRTAQAIAALSPAVTGFGVWGANLDEGTSGGTNRQASTDGFVMATAQGTESLGAIYGYTDATATPTAERQKSYRPTDALNGWQSITFPVRKGDYWRVDVNHSGVLKLCYFLPWGA